MTTVTTVIVIDMGVHEALSRASDRTHVALERLIASILFEWVDNHRYLEPEEESKNER